MFLAQLYPTIVLWNAVRSGKPREIIFENLRTAYANGIEQSRVEVTLGRGGINSCFSESDGRYTRFCFARTIFVYICGAGVYIIYLRSPGNHIDLSHHPAIGNRRHIVPTGMTD